MATITPKPFRRDIAPRRPSLAGDRRGPRALLPAILFLFLQIPVPESEGREVVTLTGDPWPPYVEGELGGEADGGIAIELVKRIFDRFPGTEVSFPLFPWNRALRAVETGSEDGIVLLLKTPEREQFLEFTEPLFEAQNLVWYSTERFPAGFQWLTLEDLDGYTIGITMGYSYGDEIDLAIESGALSVTPVPTVEHLFAMLARNRIDSALATDAVGYALAEEYAAIAEIVPASKATGTDVYHLGFSKKSPARRMIPDINRVISELRADGVIDRLIGGPAGTK